ncbi:MAG: hypothetical protein U0V73_10525 [Acidimicrobiia bacterium]
MGPADGTSTVKTLVATIRRWIAAVQQWVERTIFWRVWERLLENEFIDRSVALGAKAFVSFFPALIVVAAFMPASVRASIFTTVTHRAGLTGEGLKTVRTALKSSNDIKRATGLLGLLFMFFYVNSFTTALARVYTKAWRRPARGRVSGYAVGAVWLAGFVAFLALMGGARTVFGRGPATGLFAVIAVCGSMTLWWITPWFMLGRQVRLRPLITTGVVTGFAMSVYGATASLWMTRNVTENQHQFGFFGVALAFVTWLTGAGTIIVVGACAAPTIAEDTGVLGRLARGKDNPEVLVPGAAPSLPPPPRARLGQAIGIPSGESGVQDDDI